MQTESQKVLQELEQTTEPAASSKSNPLVNWLINTWHAITCAMTPAYEPKVWQSKDWFGHTWWNVYLPRTGQMARFSSEEEVRIWLEEHFHLL